MNKLVDMTGQRIGRYIVQGLAPSRGHGAIWSCRCDCGTIREINGTFLRSGRTKSCGCHNREALHQRRAIMCFPAIDGEEWRPVPGAQGYEVSSEGRFKGPAGGLLAGHLDKNGYPMVSIGFDDGRRKQVWLHQLVARAFIGPCPPGKECDHKDRIRTNARASNLRYVTHQENVDNSAGSRGEDHGNAKLNDELVREILAIPPAPRWGRRGKGNHPNSIISIAERYGVSVVAVHQIRRGERWAHIYEEMAPSYPHLMEAARKRS